MSESATLLQNSSTTPELVSAGVQEEFYSRDGYLVEFSGEVWVLNKDITVPVVAISGLLQPSAEISFRKVLSYFAKSHSAAHVVNMFYRCKAYLECTSGMAPFDVESLISYRSTLDQNTEWYVSVIRGFIRQWQRLGFQGVPSDTTKLLDQWVLKGNPKGFAVKSMCAETGPLTDIEMQGVLAGLVDAFTIGRLSTMSSCCAMIIMMTGRRPAQVSALKLKDVVEVAGKYWINFPRAKQRGTGWRASFKKYRIIEDLWLLIEQQKTEVIKFFRGMVGEDIPGKTLGELPLFPVKNQHVNLAELDSRLSGDFLHVPVTDIKDIMNVVSLSVSVISERTGLPMHLNARRFRYTLGTNLAREGKGEYIIAENLDHSDTQNVSVYVDYQPEIVERLNRSVAIQLAPIAQAFRGVLVTSENEAKRGNDPSSRISNGGANVGSCGSYGFCGALAPIACYTCAHFQPWINGPHEDVLAGLIEERDRIALQTGDLKIASVNDRLILAVSDVICRCKAARGEAASG
ncbi:site-specific integrase [Pseudomonas aeruginosa]|nr:site-specific integrase [Pseudomonas aeruginosa]